MHLFCVVVVEIGPHFEIRIVSPEYYLTNGTKIEPGLRLEVIEFKLFTGESINFMREK